MTIAAKDVTEMKMHSKTDVMLVALCRYSY